MLRWCRFSWRKNEMKVGQKERFLIYTRHKSVWKGLLADISNRKSKAGLSCVGAGSLFRNGSQCCVVTKCHQSKAFSFSGSVKRISSSKSFFRCWSSISGIDSRSPGLLPTSLLRYSHSDRPNEGQSLSLLTGFWDDFLIGFYKWANHQADALSFGVYGKVLSFRLYNCRTLNDQGHLALDWIGLPSIVWLSQSSRSTRVGDI